MAQSGSEVLVLPAQECISGPELSFSRPISLPRTASSSPRRSQKYPAPVIFPPLSGKHRQTFIVLHGRGSTSRRFAPALLEHNVSLPFPAAARSENGQAPASPSSQPPSPSCFNVTNLQTLMPHTRFVFPGASTRRSTTFKRTPISQWFDMNPLSDPTENEHLMNEGLKETTTYLHELIEREAKLVGGTQNILLGGLSQGCASSLVAMLLWRGEPLRAFVGMAGWLPFREHIESVAKAQRCNWELDTDSLADCGVENPFDEADTDDSASQKSSGGPTIPPQQLAVNLLRSEIDLSASPAKAGHDASRTNSTNPSLGQTPIFLGHGVDDDKVPTPLGSEAASCLEALGYNVRYETYGDLGHWYSSEMLGDIIAFLGSVTAAKQATTAQETKKAVTP